jgi:hypothetical protein
MKVIETKYEKEEIKLQENFRVTNPADKIKFLLRKVAIGKKEIVEGEKRR